MTTPKTDIGSLRETLAALRSLGKELTIRKVNSAAKPTRKMKQDALKLRKYRVRY